MWVDWYIRIIGKISNSYWSPDFAGVETSAGGTSLTLEQMKLKSSYEGWDFENIWVMKEYPELIGIRSNVQK